MIAETRTLGSNVEGPLIYLEGDRSINNGVEACLRRSCWDTEGSICRIRRIVTIFISFNEGWYSWRVIEDETARL